MFCRRCKQHKNENLFIKFNRTKDRTKDGTKGCCKQCKSEMDKKYRETNKIKLSVYFKKLWRASSERRIKNKLINELKCIGLNATEYVKDKCCEKCGISNDAHIKKYNERLHIHHKNNKGRKNIRLHKLPDHSDIEILCRPCHVREDNKDRDYIGRGFKIWKTRRNNGKRKCD